MTYEEYKNSKKGKNKKSFFKKLISKILIVIILLLCIMIACNYSPRFKEFINDKVLGDTFDFSKINNFISELNKEDKTVPAIKEVEDTKTNNVFQKYKEGVKYQIKKGESINIKESGIVTYIGEKEGYNNTIIVQQSNGYYAWYGNIKEEIKLYDYVTKGNTLGTAIADEYYFALFKDGKPLDITDEN